MCREKHIYNNNIQSNRNENYRNYSLLLDIDLFYQRESYIKSIKKIKIINNFLMFLFWERLLK